MVEFLDSRAAQHSALSALLPTPPVDVLAEPSRFAHYRWRRTVVGVLGPTGYRRVRLDRNRNLITEAEQRRLEHLSIGVIGLSVGHSIAHTLAAQGLCGRLRLADFDDLDLSNLNRVPATVFDLGVNKAVTAARRIAELDPYVDVEVVDTGVTPENIDRFLDGLDIVVEECDSLDVKVTVRAAARRRRLPVLMATSERGLVDVERFDLQPDRPLFHGLLGNIDSRELAGLSSRQKVPYVLRLLEAGMLSARGAASLVEVGHTLSTWPQLGGDVIVGAAAVAEAVRRIGLGEPLESGRTRVDVSEALSGLGEPRAVPRIEPDDFVETPPRDRGRSLADDVAAAAVRAPSGGNAQPWDIDVHPDSVVLRLAPESKSSMDVGLRGSAVAVGAAAFNARVAAANAGMLGPVEFGQGDERAPLCVTVRLAHGHDPYLEGLYAAMMSRETNRRHGDASALSEDVAAELVTAAAREGARLRLLTERAHIESAAALLADADRIRYLTPHLHADMISELRWPGDASADTGIDVRSLELDPGDLLTLEVLRRPDVMDKLAEWGGGSALAADTRARVLSSSALAVVSVDGRGLIDYARGGSAVQALWVTAALRGLAVQPVSPPFLYAHTEADLCDLSPTHAEGLRDLQVRFRALLGEAPDQAQALVMRLSKAAPASVRSRRRRKGSDRTRLR